MDAKSIETKQKYVQITLEFLVYRYQFFAVFFINQAFFTCADTILAQ